MSYFRLDSSTPVTLSINWLRTLGTCCSVRHAYA